MKMLLAFIVGGVLMIASSSAKNDCSLTDKKCQPEQIHISFGVKPHQIWVTWSTFTDTEQSLVEYCDVNSCDAKTKEGIRTEFADGKQTIHRCLLDDLEYSTTYEYKVGSKFGMSETFAFTTVPDGEGWEVKALIFGDLAVDGVSMPYIIKDASNNHYDMAFHNGDLAYNLDHNEGKRGNLFMNEMQPLAASLPYMVCPGNHEVAFNYSNYRNRFTMPLYEKFESYFYSFNLGPVHFVSVSTEVYYDNTHWPGLVYDDPTPEILTQYHWLVEDLKEANKPENRQIRPWIIMIGHRPMLCSNTPDGDQCRQIEYPQRAGLSTGGYGLEVLLKDYGVDLAVWAHEHSYERMWPMYDKKVYNGSTEYPYTNPRAPVHFTSGCAGNGEYEDRFFSDPYEWSAFRSSNYGYTRLHVYNQTHLHMEQVSTGSFTYSPRGQNQSVLKRDDNLLEPKVIDEFWLIKDSHKPYDF